MTGVRQLTDRAEIKAWLERDRRWAIYALGDLADGMFEQCEWYTAGDSLALIFRGLDFIPLVTVGGADGIEPILESAITLPRIFLNQRLEHLPAVMRYYECREPHPMLRMILEKFKPIDPPVNDGVCIMQLGMNRLEDIRSLYAASHAGDAFAPYQLATGYFYGVELDSQLVSVAGVHLASRQYKVGPIGNVGTHPAYRGRGYAAIATTAVVRALQADGITTIGLNVEQSNTAAIKVYERLGFVKHCEFVEGVGMRRER